MCHLLNFVSTNVGDTWFLKTSESYKFMSILTSHIIFDDEVTNYLPTS